MPYKQGTNVQVSYKYIKDPSEVPASLNELDKMKWCGFDSETNGTDPHTNDLILVQLGNTHKQFIYDIRYINPLLLKSILEGTKAKVTTYGVFDYRFLKANGVEPEPLYDIVLNERILLSGKVHPRTRGYFSLHGLAKKYLGIDLSKALQLSFTMQGEISEDQLKYAAGDVIYPIRILEKQLPLLRKDGLIPTAKLESDAIPAFGDMEYNGFYLDSEAWLDLEGKVSIRIKEVIKGLNSYFCRFLQTDVLGDPLISYGSNEQLLFALKKAGFDVSNTDNETLLFLPDKKLSGMLLEFRSLKKAIDSFGKQYLKFIHPKTGRVHANINQIGTTTGRVSMDKPNLQQLIKKDVGKGAAGADYRGAWRAQDGGYIIKCDYSNQELKIIAELSGEETWIQAFKEYKDLHSVTAYDVLGLEVSKTKNLEMRDILKSINFGSAYGMNYYKLIKLYGEMGKDLSESEAEGIMNKYYTIYPKIKSMLDKAGMDAITEGYTSTIGGRRRYFDIPPYKMVYSPREGKEIPVPLVWNKEKLRKLKSIIREGKNHKVQGTACDMLKKALYLLRKKIKEHNIPLQLVNVVHDEIVCEYTGLDVEYIAKEFVEKSMKEAEEYYLKLTPPDTELKIGRTWTK